MNIRKFISLIAALVLLSAPSCKKVEQHNDTEQAPTAAPTTATESSTAPTAENSPATEPASTSLYPDYPISYPEITRRDTGDLYEAESAKLTGSLSVEGELPEETMKVIPGQYVEVFSGEGYVTGFAPDGSSSVSFTVTAPSNQHYDLAFSISSTEVTDCKVILNGREISTFKTMDDGEFTLITLYGVFLTKGSCTIDLVPQGNIKLDYLRVYNNTTLSQLSYEAEEEPVNKDAGKSAKELLSFLTDNYGKYVLSGQYSSDTSDKEIELIYKTTGKYPVIRFTALHNSGSSFDSAFKEIEACADWYKKGGVVGLMWYWEAPGDSPSVYADKTDFRLADAYTDTDISQLTQEEIRGLYSSGQISKECYGLILDIDSMAGQLLTLKNKGVPVLWRPLHEASGNWFWWGADGTDAYNWLWELMYKRFTDFFDLDNLIWIWNGQSDTTVVNKSTFDIASLDIYLGSNREFGSRYEQFAALQKIVGADKLIALSECSSIPDIDAAFRDNAVWSFFGLWYGSYIEDGGKLSEEYMTKDYLVHAYNSDGVLTLDEYRTLTSGGELEPDYGD